MTELEKMAEDYSLATEDRRDYAERRSFAFIAGFRACRGMAVEAIRNDQETEPYITLLEQLGEGEAE